MAPLFKRGSLNTLLARRDYPARPAREGRAAEHPACHRGYVRRISTARHCRGGGCAAVRERGGDGMYLIMKAARKTHKNMSQIIIYKIVHVRLPSAFRVLLMVYYTPPLPAHLVARVEERRPHLARGFCEGVHKRRGVLIKLGSRACMLSRQ